MDLCSLPHAMFFLLTVKSLLLVENLYVSLNRLHAMRPQGTIGWLSFVLSSGKQFVVSPYAALLRSCLSFLLLTYLQELTKIMSTQFEVLNTITAIMEKNSMLTMHFLTHSFEYSLLLRRYKVGWMVRRER